MLKVHFKRWILVATAAAFLLAPTAAMAVSVTYMFTSGEVQLSAINTTTGNSAIAGVTPVSVPLGGTFVVFDEDLGPEGTILDLQFVPLNALNLTLDPIEAALSSISVANAILINAPGTPDATAAVSGGAFTLATQMSGDVSGTFGPMNGGGPFGPDAFTSVTSGANGSLLLDGGTLQLAIFGVNLATFGTALDPGGTDIEVKADFFFISTAVPEPGTALLMGLGLCGLSLLERRKVAQRV
jgi:hypothetical protein